jgi:uncharacterized protein YjeT (DUF2065 family)
VIIPFDEYTARLEAEAEESVRREYERADQEIHDREEVMGMTEQDVLNRNAVRQMEKADQLREYRDARLRILGMGLIAIALLLGLHWWMK